MRLRTAHLVFLALIAVLALAAGCASAPAATAPIPVAIDPVSSPDFQKEIDDFAAADAAAAWPRNAVVFTGSSSIRLWRTLAEDFPGVAVVNRGFGGSQLRDVVHYADRVALAYPARMIAVYAGDNDIDAGRTPQQVLSDFRALLTRIRLDRPKVPIVYLSIKPSPLRASQLGTQREANALVRAEAAKWRRVRFVDVATPMLDANGQPREDLFIADRLHMSPAGYEVWRRVVAPYLK